MTEQFNNNITFSMSINLLGENKKRYVVLKPNIMIFTKQEEEIVNMLKIFSIDNPIYKREFVVRKDEKTTRYQLIVQDPVKIQTILNKLKNQHVLFKFDKNNYDTFNKLFETVNKIGPVHSEWSDEFVNILEIKEQLNRQTRTRRGFTKAEWLTKINSHLQSL